MCLDFHSLVLPREGGWEVQPLITKKPSAWQPSTLSAITASYVMVGHLENVLPSRRKCLPKLVNVGSWQFLPWQNILESFVKRLYPSLPTVDRSLMFGGNLSLASPCTYLYRMRTAWEGLAGGRIKGGVFFVPCTVETSVLHYIKIVMVSAACDQEVEPWHEHYQCLPCTAVVWTPCLLLHWKVTRSMQLTVVHACSCSTQYHSEGLGWLWDGGQVSLLL